MFRYGKKYQRKQCAICCNSRCNLHDTKDDNLEIWTIAGTKIKAVSLGLENKSKTKNPND